MLNDDEIVGDLYKTLEEDNIKILAASHAGIRNVYTDKPIETPADLAGYKIRVIGSDTNVRMMELMGGIGTPMAQDEVYTAIQSGVIDGAENNELIYSTLAHDEIAPFYSAYAAPDDARLLHLEPQGLGWPAQGRQDLFSEPSRRRRRGSARRQQRPR